MEPPNSEDQDEGVGTPIPQEEEETAPEPRENVETAQSDEWWTATEAAPEWTEPETETETEFSSPEAGPRRETGTADVYFCGGTSLFSLNRALQGIAKEKLTGLLRAFWDKEPIDLLARDGEIVLVSTRDPDLYCPERPALLAEVDVVSVDRAREQQKETGTPFFLILAREESIGLGPATAQIRHYGQRLFSQLWTAARTWIMFEKNADLLTDAADLPGDPDVGDWAMETLRFVQNADQPSSFDPRAIPAYTRAGFEDVQKLKLTSDEAQFASQFNGARSVQQIAKNLRLDLKSAQQMLFRFLALEIVECWPASTAEKPQRQSFFQRFGRRSQRDR